MCISQFTFAVLHPKELKIAFLYEHEYHNYIEEKFLRTLKNNSYKMYQLDSNVALKLIVPLQLNSNKCLYYFYLLKL